MIELVLGQLILLGDVIYLQDSKCYFSQKQLYLCWMCGLGYLQWHLLCPSLCLQTSDH